MDEGVKLTIETITAGLAHFFKGREEVLLVYLFGSFTKGKIGRTHDIDMAMLVDQKSYDLLGKKYPYGYEAEITSELMKVLKCNGVDLVILNRATPLLAYEVIHHGVLLFSRSEDVRIDFEISSLRRHADTKHLRDIKRVYSIMRTDKGISAYF